MQNGIELVVVAARAAVGHAEERGRHGIGDVVEQLLAALHQIAGIALIRKVPIEAGGDQRGRIVGIELVAGDLLLHEAIVGLVLIEGIDHVVAIPPDVGARLIALEPFAIGVACEIQPVARPAFAVARRSQQAVYYLGERVGRGVGVESLHFFGRGQKTREVERSPADERDFIGRRRGLEMLLLQLGQNEGVDVVGDPVPCGRRGDSRLRHLLKSPPAALLRCEWLR